MSGSLLRGSRCKQTQSLRKKMCKHEPKNQFSDRKDLGSLFMMPGNICADEIDEVVQWKNSESRLLLEFDWLTRLSRKYSYLVQLELILGSRVCIKSTCLSLGGSLGDSR